MVLDASHRTTTAPITITRIASGLPITHVALCASVSFPVQS